MKSNLEEEMHENSLRGNVLSLKIILEIELWNILSSVWKNKIKRHEAVHHRGFSGGTRDKEPACQCWRHKRCKFNPWIRMILGGGHGNPLQYSCLENPWTEEPGGLQSRRLQRVGHDWRDLAHSASQWEEPELQISSLLLQDRVTFTSSECPHLSVWDVVGARCDTSNLQVDKERASKYLHTK